MDSKVATPKSLNSGFVLKVMVCAVALGLGGIAAAQEAGYPSKQIRFIVGYAPGGATDIIARAVAAKLSVSMGQQVVVDNRAGGNGNTAAILQAKSPPDGYNMMLGTISTLATNVSMYPDLPYDPVKDFAPVALVASSPYLLMIHPSVKAGNVREFIALAKANPGTLNYGSSGSGGGAHLSMEMLNSMAGIKTVHVPYKGSAPALTDLIGGRIQAGLVSPIIAIPPMKAGTLKGLAITSANRLSAMPDVPTVAEMGVPGYEATAWQGIVTTAGTPRPIINKIYTETAAALKMPDVRERLAADGSEPGNMGPDQFGAFIRSEIAKWAKVVKESGAKAD